MQLNEKQFKKIAALLPKQRGNVKIDNLTIINALLYVDENGCKCRDGPWHTVYMRFSRWVKNGVIDKVFNTLHEEFNVTIVLSLDNTCVKAHPDGTGCQRTVRKASARSGAVKTPKSTRSWQMKKRLSFFIFHEAI